VRVPSLPSSKSLENRTFPLSAVLGAFRRWAWMGRERIEAVEDASVGVCEEVAIEVERDSNRRMLYLRLELLRMGSGGDHQRGVRCGAVVEAETRQLRPPDSGPEDAVAKGLVVQERAAR
jgi:hypothetical protein